MKRHSLLLSIALSLPGFIIGQSVHAESLKSAVEYTVLNNPSIAITGRKRQQIDQELKQSKSLFLPSVDLTADAGRERSRNFSTNEQWATLNRRQAGVDVTQNLFAGFGDVNRVKENRFRVAAAAFQVTNTAQNTAYKAIEAYINVLRTKRLVEIARMNVASHVRTDRMLRERGESGIARKADTIQASGRLSLARSNLKSEINNYEDAIADYMRVVGHAPRNLSLPVLPSHALPRSLNAAIEFALENNPAVHSDHANLLARQHQRKVAMAEFYPRLDLVLSSRRGRDIGGIESMSNEDNALLQLNYNIFRGGADYYRVQQAAYSKQEAFEEIRDTQRDIIQSTRLAWNALKTTQYQLSDLKVHRDDAQMTVGAYKEQFTLDKRTLVDLLNADNEYFSASRDYANGQFDVLLNQYRLLTAIGSVLDTLNIVLPSTARHVRMHQHPLEHLPEIDDMTSHQPVFAVAEPKATHSSRHKQSKNRSHLKTKPKSATSPAKAHESKAQHKSATKPGVGRLAYSTRMAPVPIAMNASNTTAHS